MPRVFGGPGIFPSNAAIPGYGDELVLQAGATWTIPAGNFLITSLSGLSTIQQYDPISDTWRPVGSAALAPHYIQSEGNNYRVANQSGCMVGAYVTAKGSGYTSAPTVVATAGNSVWASIIGGVLTSVAVTNGGANYAYPPLVFFDAPAGTPNPTVLNPNGAPVSPGFMASAYATITSGVVTGITLNDQGAGYVTVPNTYLVNDPRDTTGSGASATAVIGGANQLSGVVSINHGTAVTSLPSLTISGGGGSGGTAVPIADFAVTGINVTAGGTGFPTSSIARIIPISPILTGAAWTNPTMETSILVGKDASLGIVTTSGGALTTGSPLAAPNVAGYGGSYPAAPTAYGIATSSLITGGPTATFNVGGLSDTIIIAQI